MSRVPGGWLLLLAVLLLVWQPVSFGLVASTMLVRLPGRGLPLAAIIFVRLIVVAFGIAAGLALLRGGRDGVMLAKIALAATAALDVFIYTTPYYPTNLPPGDAKYYATASVLYSAMWIGYLMRSKRVREITINTEHTETTSNLVK
jgi:hypothetical protein